MLYDKLHLIVTSNDFSGRASGLREMGGSCLGGTYLKAAGIHEGVKDLQGYPPSTGALVIRVWFCGTPY